MTIAIAAHASARPVHAASSTAPTAANAPDRAPGGRADSFASALSTQQAAPIRPAVAHAEAATPGNNLPPAGQQSAAPAADTTPPVQPANANQPAARGKSARTDNAPAPDATPALPEAPPAPPAWNTLQPPIQTVGLPPLPPLPTAVADQVPGDSGQPAIPAKASATPATASAVAASAAMAAGAAGLSLADALPAAPGQVQSGLANPSSARAGRTNPVVASHAANVAAPQTRTADLPTAAAKPPGRT